MKNYLLLLTGLLLSASGYAQAGYTCANPIAFTMQGSSSPVAYTSVNHSSTTGAQCPPFNFAGFAEDEYWFTFQALGTSATIRSIGSANYDPVIIVYDTCGGTELACLDSNFGGGTDEMTVLNGLTINNTYYIWAYDYQNDGGNFTLDVFGTIMPVVYSSFSGEALPLGNEIEWVTTNEINNSHFELQRATEGLSFETIALIPAEQDAAHGATYSYTDPLPYPSSSYRLKQVDLDGTTSYSDVIALRNDYLSQSKSIAYPNPSTGSINLNLYYLPKNITAIALYNNMGQLIYRQDSHMEGTITLDQLAPGAYNLLLQENETTVSAKRIVVK